MTIREVLQVATGPDAYVVENLSFSYANRRLYDSTCIEIPRGGITGLIGPNGCGKSTLFNLLAQELVRKSGADSLMARDLVLMSQDYTLPGLLSVEESASLILQLNSAPTISTDAISETWSAREKEKWRQVRKRLASQCSVGERKWVCLRTLISLDRSLYLLDEPTAGVDSDWRLEIWKLLKQQSELGKTFIVSSHLLDEIVRFSRPIYLVKHRKLFRFPNGEAIQLRISNENPDQASMSPLAGEHSIFGV